MYLATNRAGEIVYLEMQDQNAIYWTRDGDEDDAFDALGTDVNWENVWSLREQYSAVNAIYDDNERLEAAKRLTSKLGE